MGLYVIQLISIWILLGDKITCKVISSNDEILQYENLPWDGRQYSFRYNTKNGVSVSQNGELKTSENGNMFVGVSGKYSYPVDNRYIMTIEYEASDNGYQIKRFKLIRSDNNIKEAVPDDDDDNSLLDDRFTDPRVAATLLGG